MVELIESIVISFLVLSFVGMFGSIGKPRVRCEECNKKIVVNYNQKDSIYYAECKRCNIIYNITFE